MHSRIFELSTKEVPEKDWVKIDDLPESFFGRISDWADEVEKEYRNSDINWLIQFFKGLGKREGDTISFQPDLKEQFFRTNYLKFVEAANRLAQCSYEEFAGIKISSQFRMAHYELKEAFDDEFGFYIYDHNNCELCTLDSWIRDADLTKKYYVGGIIDYHF